MAAVVIDPPMNAAPHASLDTVFEGRPTCSDGVKSDFLDTELEEVPTTPSREGSSRAHHLRSAAVAMDTLLSKGQDVVDAVSTYTVGQHKKDGAYTVKGGHSTRIPKSAWGVAAIMPIVSEVKTCSDWFRVCFLSYFCLVLSAITQMSFVYGIKSITVEEEGVTCDSLAMDANLVLLCLIIYLLSVFNDIEETFDLAEVYFDMIPTVHGRSEVLFFDEDNNVASGGFSVERKVFLGVCVLLLKLFIAILLGINGTVYLAASATDSELLLNTLALEFVLGVDEMIYASLAPMSTRSIMMQIPPFRTQKRRCIFRWADSISPINKVLFCIWAARWTMFMVNPATAECIAHLPGFMQGKSPGE